MSSFPARALLASTLFAVAFVRAQDGAAPTAPSTAPAAQPVPATTAEDQTKEQQHTPPPAPAAPPLSLEDCIALAMKKNFDLQIQGYSVEQARESLTVAKADLLPTITGSTSRTLSRSTAVVPQPDGTALVLPQDQNSTSFRAGVSEKIPQTNGVLSLSGSLSQTSTQKPRYTGGPSLNLSQPLLSGAGRTIARANIERNKIGLGIAYVNYRSQVLTVIRNTEDSYYNLVAARETIRIRQLSLDLAQKLYDENTARRTSGMATDLDVATAQVGVANARLALTQAQKSARDAEDQLLSLINTGDFDTRLGPVAFKDYSEGQPSFAVAYKLARDRYPDTLSAQEVIKQLQIDLAVAKRNRLPSLTLNVSVGYNTSNVSYGEVISTIPNDHGDLRSLSLQYSIPWGTTADRARYRSAMASVNAQKLRVDQLEQQLLVNVRAAVRSVETNISSVQIAAQATQLAAKQYDLQKARYDAGLSTSRLVLQAQDDLETARFNELSAKATLWTAVAELHRLEGTSIEQYGVQVQ